MTTQHPAPVPVMQPAVEARNRLGECALWCDRTQRLFWTDIHASTLWAYAPATGTSNCWPTPERVASFALTDDNNQLLLALASRLAFFDIGSGAVRDICAIEPELPTTRANDGRCDRQGRFVFGTLNEGAGREPIGGFYRLNRDLTLERLPLKSVVVANSICFSLDGRTMYYCDSWDKAIRCCDYDPDTGAIANDRVFVALGELAGEPDGSTVDAEGYLWNAVWGSAKVVRFAPDGKVDRIIEVPASQPTCPVFGGPMLDTLYVTSATDGLSSDALAMQPQAGAVFSMHLEGVRGLPEQRFLPLR